MCTRVANGGALDLPADRAIVDGGILAPEPLGIARACELAPQAVAVPHWESLLLGGWAEACDHAGLALLDPMQPKVTAIAAAPLVINESLHGAIMADALRVPWIPIVTTANLPLFKWFNWTAFVATPLRMVPMRLPSSSIALMAFGRPGIGASGRPVPVDESQAFVHLARWGIEDATAIRHFAPSRIAGNSPLALVSGSAVFHPDVWARHYARSSRTSRRNLARTGRWRNDERCYSPDLTNHELRSAYAEDRLGVNERD